MSAIGVTPTGGRCGSVALDRDGIARGTAPTRYAPACARSELKEVSADSRARGLAAAHATLVRHPEAYPDVEALFAVTGTAALWAAHYISWTADNIRQTFADSLGLLSDDLAPSDPPL